MQFFLLLHCGMGEGRVPEQIDVQVVAEFKEIGGIAAEQRKGIASSARALEPVKCRHVRFSRGGLGIMVV